MARRSSGLQAAGQLSSLAALLLLGLAQDLVMPSHILLACGLLVLLSFLGTALRPAPGCAE